MNSIKGIKPAKSVIKTKFNNNKGLTLKKRMKVAKTSKQNANFIITGYEPVGLAIMNICDITYQ